MTESELYKIVQRHQDAFGPSAAEIARRIGAQPQTVSSWKTRGLTKLPEKRFLVALAQLTHTPYGDVLTAALRDTGYLPEREDAPVERRPTTTVPAVEVDADLDESGQGRVTGRAASKIRNKAGGTRTG